MDKMPLVAVIFQSIPEEIIMYCFGMAIVGEYININKIVIASTITSFAMMFARWFVPYFGLHSIIGVLLLLLFFWKFLGLKWWKALVSSLLSVIVLLLLETFILQAILNLKHITAVEMLQDNLKRIIYFYPHLTIFGLGTWFIYLKKWSLIKGSRVGDV
ncbi:hypothetical protein L7E55_05430 [Pelotomaculum isophthalicicum JI]|uniref:Uncharacterized protein n=1 Tax=Pelotomaculum isophthalicicum JI TaxID=947010 RepID=A0A9X4H7J9_9FIRM|nr:hypothetical protein [Pelotomaculum isophthalicicum]MDF9407804.1 hypothetical protein [Pelotomaculum isophthalicicum JI]